MKKIALSLFVIASFIFYAFAQRRGGSPVATLPPTGQSNLPESSRVSGSTPPPGTSNGKYKDGTYTGSSADAYYGNVQVKATISGGKLTDVQFLDYPHDRRNSEQINSYATPILTQEAIQVQSANVDVVSGATATSGAFQQSLQSALDKAV